MPGVYRFQGIHVGYWRGQVKRWNVTSHYGSSESDDTVAGCIPDYVAKTQALGASSYPGGLAEVKVYSLESPGVPIASLVRFDYEVPADWLPYTGTAWGAGNAPFSSGEECGDLRTAAGTSRTGKTVYVRWYWHAGLYAVGATPDTAFAGSVITAVNTAYNAFQTLSSGGSAVAVLVKPNGDPVALTGALEPYVSAHQRVRGRRRSTGALIRSLQSRGVSVGASSAPIEVD